MMGSRRSDGASAGIGSGSLGLSGMRFREKYMAFRTCMSRAKTRSRSTVAVGVGGHTAPSTGGGMYHPPGPPVAALCPGAATTTQQK